jgi:hypothetical protein
VPGNSLIFFEELHLVVNMDFTPNSYKVYAASVRYIVQDSETRAFATPAAAAGGIRSQTVGLARTADLREEQLKTGQATQSTNKNWENATRSQ